MSESSSASVLVVILDCDAHFWSTRHQEMRTIDGGSLIGFNEAAEQITLFMNAYLMLHAGNRLAFIANHPTNTKFLFPVSVSQGDSQTQFLENISSILEELKNLGKTPIEGNTRNSQFSAALSMSLCYINKIKKAAVLKDQTDYRILVIQGADDMASQYIPMMNCIFTAQKIGVLVDACVLSKKESTFLQQATDLTNGSYLRLPKFQKALLQQLFTVFLPDKSCRKLLNIPLQNEVDFRASCFCHRHTIDTGYVCSVCLSIFCEFKAICTTCGTKFRVPRPKKKKSISNK